jgi:hypothetical protein
LYDLAAGRSLGTVWCEDTRTTRAKITYLLFLNEMRGIESFAAANLRLEVCLSVLVVALVLDSHQNYTLRMGMSL